MTLTVDGVTKLYNKTIALNDVSICIPDGEFLVLVGPSGCGKTTLLRCIAGMEKLSKGAIYLNSHNIQGLSLLDLNIAWVPQSYALYPHMSAFANMAFPLRLRGMRESEIQTQVWQVAKDLDIDTLLYRRPRELSGGQRQRVALGRALVRNPQVFLFDEPLSSLDAKIKVQARDLIKDLHTKLGVTFVYVTHDLTEARHLADRIAVIDHGVLQQIDKPETLIHSPANPFVADFITGQS
jgi:multiple sugar transport system ATP-binding protein